MVEVLPEGKEQVEDVWIGEVLIAVFTQTDAKALPAFHIHASQVFVRFGARDIEKVFEVIDVEGNEIGSFLDEVLNGFFVFWRKVRDEDVGSGEFNGQGNTF